MSRTNVTRHDSSTRGKLPTRDRVISHRLTPNKMSLDLHGMLVLLVVLAGVEGLVHEALPASLLSVTDGAPVKGEMSHNIPMERGMWSAENACVSFDKWGAARVTERDTGKKVELPMFKADILDQWINYTQPEESQVLSSECQESDKDALFLLTQTLPANIYHAMYQMVASKHKGSDSVEVLSNVQIPKGMKRMPLPGLGPVHKTLDKWFAYKLFLHAAKRNNQTDEELMERQHELYKQCTCYKHIYGGHNGFLKNTYEPKRYEHIRNFKNNLWAHPKVRAKPELQQTRILFILRNKRRVITNEAEVVRKLDEGKGYHVEYVHFEEYTPLEQVQMAMNSRMIVSVHGAALAYGLFLPSETLPTGLVEILPYSDNTEGMFRDFTINNRAQYTTLHHKDSICQPNKLHHNIFPVMSWEEYKHTFNITVASDDIGSRTGLTFGRTITGGTSQSKPTGLSKRFMVLS
ncbi:hypothetical protein AAMO2058_000990800 [Amorphochlora amoebiformis]